MAQIGINVTPCEDSDITLQVLRSKQTTIFDLADALNELKGILTEQDYQTIQTGVDNLIGLLVESAGEHEVKIIISKL